MSFNQVLAGCGSKHVVARKDAVLEIGAVLRLKTMRDSVLPPDQDLRSKAALSATHVSEANGNKDEELLPEAFQS